MVYLIAYSQTDVGTDVVKIQSADLRPFSTGAVATQSWDGMGGGGSDSSPRLRARKRKRVVLLRRVGKKRVSENAVERQAVRRSLS